LKKEIDNPDFKILSIEKYLSIVEKNMKSTVV